MENAGGRLEEKVLMTIKHRVMKLEVDNAKTKEKNDKKMMDEIIKIIEEEVRCSLKD